MNKEQQALNTLREKGYTNHFQPITLEQQYPNEFKILQELVDQQNQPTLEQCIKEWEEKGWKTSYICDGIELSKLNDDIVEYFYFDKDLKRIDCNCFISFDLIPLIHKTLKALEEMKDEQV